MEEKQRNQEEWNPRHVEERCRASTRQERAHLVEIAQRLLGENWFCPSQRQGDEREVNLGLQFNVEQGGNPRQHTAAECVEITLQQVSYHHYRREPEQRCNVAARDHAIVNLQHVERAGQREQVDHSAKYRHAR